MVTVAKTIAQSGNNPNVHQGMKINKMWCIHIVKCYSATKRNVGVMEGLGVIKAKEVTVRESNTH